MMPISVDDVEAIRGILSTLPRNEPKHVTKQEAIALLASELCAAQRRGYNAEDLARLISERGIEVNGMALKNYLRQSRKSRKRSRGKNAPTAGPSIGVGTEPPATRTPPADVLHGPREAARNATAPGLPTHERPERK
jgi:hypothetical protein